MSMSLKKYFYECEPLTHIFYTLSHERALALYERLQPHTWGELE